MMPAVLYIKRVVLPSVFLLFLIQVGISFMASIVVAMISEATQLPMGVLLLCTAFLGLAIYQTLKQPSWKETGESSHLGAE